MDSNVRIDKIVLTRDPSGEVHVRAFGAARGTIEHTTKSGMKQLTLLYKDDQEFYPIVDKEQAKGFFESISDQIDSE